MKSSILVKSPIMQSERREAILQPFSVNSRQYGCPENVKKGVLRSSEEVGGLPTTKSKEEDYVWMLLYWI